MGYKIHFDEEVVGTDELKLIETKKAILEKLRVRFGFEYARDPRAVTAQAAAVKALPAMRAPQHR